ncbi:hypothetical protein [Bowmanella denitrificans]|nr:hypothetical protein [Bowmanella denitrificans]
MATPNPAPAKGGRYYQVDGKRVSEADYLTAQAKQKAAKAKPQEKA